MHHHAAPLTVADPGDPELPELQELARFVRSALFAPGSCPEPADPTLRAMAANLVDLQT